MKGLAEGQSDVGLDELGMWFASRFVEVVEGRSQPAPQSAAARDRRRAVDAAMWIDANSHDDIGLDASKTGGTPAFEIEDTDAPASIAGGTGEAGRSALQLNQTPIP